MNDCFLRGITRTAEDDLRKEIADVGRERRIDTALSGPGSGGGMGCRGLGSERVCRRLDEAVGGVDAQQVSCAGVRGGHHVLFGNAPEQKAELGGAAAESCCAGERSAPLSWDSTDERSATRE